MRNVVAMCLDCDDVVYVVDASHCVHRSSDNGYTFVKYFRMPTDSQCRCIISLKQAGGISGAKQVFWTIEGRQSSWHLVKYCIMTDVKQQVRYCLSLI